MGKERKKPKKKPPPTPPPAPSPPVVTEQGLDDEEQLFLAEWLVFRNAAQAYRATHPDQSYRTARCNGPAMLARPHVRAEASAAVAAQCRRRAVTADRTLDEIARCAYSDILDLYDPATGQLRMPRHIPLEARKAISSIRVNRQRRSVTTSGRTRTTVVDTVVEYRLWPKLEALKMLSHTLGLKTEVTPLEQLLRLLPRALSEQIRAALAAQEEARSPQASSNGRH
jgi:phage terminase small subunit